MRDNPRPTFQVESEHAFRVNGKLIDLVHIEHWGCNQGGAKFHGIRTALTILRHFTRKMLQAEAPTVTPEQAERVFAALRRLSEYGYYIPPEVLAED